MARAITDVEEWADLHTRKLAVLVALVGDNPAAAGRVLMVMDIDAAEARALVTQAIVNARSPAAYEAVCGLGPVVRAWIRRPDVVALVGDDAEALGWLWAWVVALGWVCER